MNPPLRAEYDGITIDYAAFTTNEDRNLTLLTIAERENLLEHLVTLPDGAHYGVLCNGRHLVLTAEEIPPFVLGLFVAAGKDIRVVNYRTGLVRSEQPLPK